MIKFVLKNLEVLCWVQAGLTGPVQSCYSVYSSRVSFNTWKWNCPVRSTFPGSTPSSFQESHFIAHLGWIKYGLCPDHLTNGPDHLTNSHTITCLSLDVHSSTRRSHLDLGLSKSRPTKGFLLLLKDVILLLSSFYRFQLASVSPPFSTCFYIVPCDTC